MFSCRVTLLTGWSQETQPNSFYVFVIALSSFPFGHKGGLQHSPAVDDHGYVHLLAVVAYILDHCPQSVRAGRGVVVRPARVVELRQVEGLSILLCP